MGSDLKKPDSTNVVSREGFRELLYPLPVTALMYVGRVTADSLERVGVRTVGQLAAIDADALGELLGKQGRALHAQANGLDDEPVRRTSELEGAKSIGNSMTFRRDLISQDDISIGLRTLCESVARRLRAHGKKCYGVQIAIKDPDLKIIGRQARLPRPTHLTKAIYEAALSLTLKTWKVGKPIRLLSVTAINLTGARDGGQMDLFADEAGERKQEALERSLDALRDKYGSSVVKPAATLRNDLGIDDG
jgi:DNA polymerase-4